LAKWRIEHPDYAPPPPTEEQRLARLGARRRWAKDNPEISGLNTSIRRALKRGLPREDAKALTDFYRFACTLNVIPCPMCGKETRSRKERDVDHIIPLSKGGAHSVENLQILCSSCNRKKGAKLLVGSKPGAMAKRP
jgi:hypothetical protein